MTYQFGKFSKAILQDDQKADAPQLGDGKCTRQGCSCPSYQDPPGGFDCSRCGHPKSDHW